MVSKQLFIVLHTLILLGSFAACRPGNTQEESTTKSLVNSGHGWPGGVVRTCFINGDQYPQAAQMVRTAVTSNFSKSNVGIEFTGWGSCEDDPSAGARVWFGVERAYSTYIGTLQIALPEPKDHPSLTIGLMSPGTNQFYDYNTALHEFGHFAGLFHEQARMENLNGGACTKQETGPLKYPNFVKPSMKPIANFDYGSIMNYCVQGYETRHLMLSQSDIQGLRYIYGLSSSIVDIDNSQNPGSLCNKMEIAPFKETIFSHMVRDIYSNDQTKVTAYSDERISSISGWIDVGTKVSRLKTVQKEVTAGYKAESITMMQVIPETGILANQKVWIWGNVTKEIGCRGGATVVDNGSANSSSVNTQNVSTPSFNNPASNQQTGNYSSVFTSTDPVFTNPSSVYSNPSLPDYGSLFSSSGNSNSFPDYSSVFSNSSSGSNSPSNSSVSPSTSVSSSAGSSCNTTQLNICLQRFGSDSCYARYGCSK